VNPGFCEKMEVTRVPPGRPSRTTGYAYHRLRVPQVGNPCCKRKLRMTCTLKNVFLVIEKHCHGDHVVRCA